MRARLFQFEFDGALLPFSQARPAFVPLFRLPKRQGERTPALFEPLKADGVPYDPYYLITTPT